MNDPPDLVIFDCDGVLVDSEVISNRIFMESFAELGIVFTLEEMLAFGVGKNAVTLAAAIEQEFGVTLPGVPELLAALSLKRCVASNSHIRRVRHALTTTELMPHLEPHIYTPAMVARGKPAPDLFLYAAKQHDVRPERCLVIEDSVSGVVAALAAGMPVIGFTGGSHCRPGRDDAMREAGCVAVFGRMDEVAAFLRVRDQRDGRRSSRLQGAISFLGRV
jgi:HAD superfamily hydrolase (TIGR01509 family)